MKSNKTSLPDKRLDAISEPRLFERYRRRAAKLAHSPRDLRRLISAATSKAQRVGGISARFKSVQVQLATLIALLRAWVGGSYRQVSTSTIVTVAAAVLYFVIPLDLLPDFILGMGLIDDVAVISYVFSAVRDEIAAFERWRSAHQPRPPRPGDGQAAPTSAGEASGNEALP